MTSQSDNFMPPLVNLGWVAKVLAHLPASGLKPTEKEFLAAWGTDNYVLERGRCRILVKNLNYYRLIGLEKMYERRN